MVYHRQGRRSYFVAVPTRTGSVKRSTGTADRATAKAMGRMLTDLRDRRVWDVLEAVARNRLRLAALFDAYRVNDLDGLRARMADEDLAEHIDGWTAWLADRVSADTADHYLAHLRTLIPAGTAFYRSQFTAPGVAKWLATRTALVQKRRPSASNVSPRENPAPRPVTGSTKRRYLAAVQSFAAYLLNIGVLASNPLRDVNAPPANPPRCVFLELPDVLRVVDGAPRPFQAIYALAYGAGLELSAILALVDADVEPRRREVHARGTKAWTRDRLARVADWAWPFVEAHLKTVLPGERLFRGVDRWQASDLHRERLRILGLPHHRLHDSRHHWAVRMVRAGMPLELVARQLGHRDVVMVAKVYGRFVPTSQERDRWEGIAAELDAEKWGRVGTSGGTYPPGADDDAVQKSPASTWDAEASDDSRGGTRTHDPGIMSAVL